MPNGLKVIVALLALSALGAGSAVLLPYGEVSWLFVILGAFIGLVAIGLVFRNRTAYFCFLILAGVTIVSGVVFLTIMGTTIVASFEPSAIFIAVVALICLGIWIWAYGYVRSSRVRKWYFGEA